MKPVAATLAALTVLSSAPALAVEEPWATLEGAEFSLARWFTPGTAGGTDFDYSSARPTWTVGFTRWDSRDWQDWGLGAGATFFGETRVPFQAAPFFPGGSHMGDLQLKRRWLDGRLVAAAGFRWLSFRKVSYGTLSAAYDQPLVGDWLHLKASALAGTNVNLAYVLDGQAALEARFGTFGLSAGYRTLALQCGCEPPEPTVNLSGPVVEAALRF